jgi:enamine deaminase RidA (YjgF/YER057c/UK114 family)
MVQFSGQVGSDINGKIVASGDIAGQFGQAIRNLGIAIDAARCLPDDVVKITYYVTDVAAYQAASKAIGEHYRAVFGRHYPASTLVEVRRLFDPQAMVEIDAVAVRS